MTRINEAGVRTQKNSRTLKESKKNIKRNRKSNEKKREKFIKTRLRVWCGNGPFYMAYIHSSRVHAKQITWPRNTIRA